MKTLFVFIYISEGQVIECMTLEQERRVEDNISLVYHIVSKTFHRRIDEGDIKQLWTDADVADYIGAGYEGLCKASLTFKETCETKFSTYAYICIYNSIANELKINGKFEKNNIKVLHYDKPMKGEEDKRESTAWDFIEDQKDYINDSVFMMDLAKAIEKAFANSTEYQKKIFELIVYDGMTQTEIAKALGCSRQNVNQTIVAMRKKVLEHYEGR